jgi:hypothetical protein
MCAALFLASASCSAQNRATPQPRTATPEQAIEAKTDVWGEAALQQPEGPTYDFFAKLLPPIRYVDADFHDYPINLSAPKEAAKVRVVSDGSAINALARQPNWRTEAGTPLLILVGNDREPFGAQIEQLQGPKFLDGYLPILNFSYQHRGESYHEEIFALTDPMLAKSGAVLVRLDFPAADQGRYELRLQDGYHFFPGGPGNVVRDDDGKVVLAYDTRSFEWNKYRAALQTKTTHARSAYVLFFTTPVDPHDLKALGAAIEESATKPATTTNGEKFLKAGNVEPPAGPPGELPTPKFSNRIEVPLNQSTYDAQRNACIQAWSRLLADGADIQVPEPYVNQACRGLIVGSYMIAVGDHLNYSAGNQYSRMYVAECGNAMTSLLLMGHMEDARQWLGPILAYERPNMGFHNGGLKLQLLAHYYWVTRDKQYIENAQETWQRQIKVILDARDPKTGMMPKEKYCGDIDDLVHSLNSAAISWRGVRDIAAVLDDIGHTQRARELRQLTDTWRAQLQDAINKAAVPQPDGALYIPVYPGEALHDPITASRLGSYWNLITGYMLHSGVFPYDSPQITGLLKFLQTRGGLCMGMVRVQSAQSFYVGRPVPLNIDDLYGLDYALKLQQRDEPDRALVSFYGKLAQGMTRDTYEDGEATSILPLDRFGRQVYLPPNSAANGSFLQQLRYLLVQDWDLNDDSKPDTLRLCYATPRQWLEDGKRIEVKNAPTDFGPMSMSVQSHIASNAVTAELDLPSRNAPQKILLKLRLPSGYKIVRATAGEHERKVDNDVIDLTGLAGKTTVAVQVIKSP